MVKCPRDERHRNSSAQESRKSGAQLLWDNNDGQNEVLPLGLRSSRRHLLDAAHVTGMVLWGPSGRSAGPLQRVTRQRTPVFTDSPELQGSCCCILAHNTRNNWEQWEKISHPMGNYENPSVLPFLYSPSPNQSTRQDEKNVPLLPKVKYRE